MSGRLLIFGLALVTGCGAKTGLKIPDASRETDACTSDTAILEPRDAVLMFVIDRSVSMDVTIDGREPSRGEPTRWELLHDALADALQGHDDRLAVGAKLYPDSGGDGFDPASSCIVGGGIDLPPARRQRDALLSLLSRTMPAGGTPTAPALDIARRSLAGLPPDRPRFMVLATDGAPNCNPDTGLAPGECVCTWHTGCTDALVGPYLCLDDDRTLRSIDAAVADGIPVYVVGIENPERPDLSDVLDRMAIAGGRPRSDPGEPRFFNVRAPDDLARALGQITDTIGRCVFELPERLAGAEIVLEVDGRDVPHDPGRVDGWDWTVSGGAEITLFGRSCERAVRAGTIVASLPCAR